MNYYNEFDPKAAAGLKQLIVDGLIPKGDVDERSITEVRASELAGYTQCHFFAGIGGWSRALHLAGWPTDRSVWTGSCPCQPFSSAGKQRGGEDHRHLWPVWFNLIRECQPSRVYGEQVASAISHGWLDGVYVDMEAQEYSCGSAVLPAISIDAPHKRDRLWFVANATDSIGRRGHIGLEEKAIGTSRNDKSTGDYTSNMADAESKRSGGTEWTGSESLGRSEADNSLFSRRTSCGGNGVAQGDTESEQTFRQGSGRFQPEPSQPSGSALVNSVNSRSQGLSGDVNGRDQSGRIASGQNGSTASPGFWDDHQWIVCADGKIRRIPAVESGIRLLAYGVPERVGLLRSGGNAIVPEVAARFIKATDQAICGIAA